MKISITMKDIELNKVMQEHILTFKEDKVTPIILNSLLEHEKNMVDKYIKFDVKFIEE